ncbi:hypothetical protein H8S90_03995 [Olivibacter sp. SDN3]|uniref:hypothetical protein n=1 Tax=Olivibacter sp. SDN3 TaxID=2764720 RepID=UPI001651AF9D|nr:hypothetical protein [Olivibacter sp. SDN3]QNL50766.1 hypothetical protein H8S90_03995 [Olivibacter sp. SDN3]
MNIHGSHRPVCLLLLIVFEYWGGYTCSKKFDLLIDNQKVATQHVGGLKDGSFVTVEYDLPEAIVTGKKTVRVKIVPHKRSRGRPLFVTRTITE